ncbi:unnamed protein product [Paramecium pentaurelia]|uniref:UBX domain-containing protein n=1 Tax=Paramecium pentaurelia TaxID=43138 RepID=A0A8S1SQX4_9CILI|nr:unnamed protein product [Paramecium pentaurelia]
MQPPSSEESIINFMAVTGCQDYQKAQSYIQMAENKLDTAIQLYLDFEGVQSQTTQQKTQQDQQQQRSNIQETPKGNVQSSNQSIQRQPQDVALIEKYRKYQEEKRANEDGIIKKTFQYGANFISYFFKNAPNYGNEFLKYLKQHQIQTEIAFQSGNFLEKLKIANEETRPLLVYIHNHQSLMILQKMSNCKAFVTNINRNYNIIGLLSSPQVYEQLPNKPDPPAILIYKLDIVDEVALMEQISLSIDTNFEETAQKIKQIRAAFNKEYIYIENIKKEVNSPNQFNQNYYHQNYHQNQQLFHHVQQQQQPSQVQRQREDQRQRELLLQQQKEAYHYAEQQAMEKKRKDEELRQQEQAKLIEQQQKEEQRLLQKAQLLSNLPEEPQNSEGISILFRFVNATRTRRFNFNDKIQILFDFVQSQEDDCFHDPYAKIDLIQNFPRLSLKDKTESPIKEVFIDSEMEQLIVDEQE